MCSHFYPRLRGCRHQLQAGLTSELVKPSLLGSVMLNTIQMFFPVVHVVLKGPVTVVTEVSLPHGGSSMHQPARRHFRNVYKDTGKGKFLIKLGECQHLGPENVARRYNHQWCDGLDLNQCSLSAFIIASQSGLVHLLQIWPWIWNNYIRDNWSGDQYRNKGAQIVALQRHLWLPSSGLLKKAPCLKRPFWSNVLD